MRLTPPWFRSSSEDSPEEGSDDPDTSTGVTIYHSPPSEVTGDTSVSQRRAASFIPESDAALVAVLEEMSTPATVDEVADQLIEPAQPPVKTWATVHERLHKDRLPELDATGDIVFDESQGIVERPSHLQPNAQAGIAVASSGSRTVLSDPSVGVLVLLSIILLSAVIFVAMAFVV